MANNGATCEAAWPDPTGNIVLLPGDGRRLEEEALRGAGQAARSLDSGQARERPGRAAQGWPRLVRA